MRPRPPPHCGTAATPRCWAFLACACVVRRAAFLGVGGFSELLFFIGEERLLAYDLAAAGWGRHYRAEVVACHHPSPLRPDPGRRRRAELRNAVLTAWLRRPAAVALAETRNLASEAARDRDARGPWRGRRGGCPGRSRPAAGSRTTSSGRSWP